VPCSTKQLSDSKFDLLMHMSEFRRFVHRKQGVESLRRTGDISVKFKVNLEAATT